MSKKDLLKKSLEQSKKLIQDNETKKVIKQKELESIGKELTNLNPKGKQMKNKTEVKSDIALLKSFAKATGQSAQTLVQEYMVEKGEDSTSINQDMINDVKDTNIILSHDPKELETRVLSLFPQENMQGQRSKTVYFDNENLVAKVLAEGASIKALGDQTFDFFGKEMKTKRASLTTSLTKELTSYSKVDLIRYLQGKVSKIVAKSAIEAIFNGQGASAAQQDSGYSATGAGQVGAGLRAELSALGQIEDVGAALDRAKMMDIFESAGDIFAESQDGWAIFAPKAEKIKLSALKRASSSEKLDEGKVYEDSYLGVPVYQINALPAAVHTDGFIDATGGNNVKGHLVLTKPSQTKWAVEDLEVIVKYDEDISTFRMTVNFQLGVCVLSNASNQHGVLAINITR